MTMLRSKMEGNIVEMFRNLIMVPKLYLKCPIFDSPLQLYKSSNVPHSTFHDLIRVKGAFACFPPSRRSVQAENLRGGASFEAHIDNELLSRDVSGVLACVESLRDSIRHTLQSGLLLIRFLSSFFVASEQNHCKYDYISNYGHFDTACDIWCLPQTCIMITN